jgi:hypothetical protein
MHNFFIILDKPPTLVETSIQATKGRYRHLPQVRLRLTRFFLGGAQIFTMSSATKYIEM